MAKTYSASLLSVYDENGNKIAIPAIKGEDGKDGKDGYTPQKNVDYFDGASGKDGTSVAVSKVSESSEPGGTNTVTFSDGNKVNIKNGKDGAKGDDYVLTEADKQEIASMVIDMLQNGDEVSY
jgi:hypothetical protein